MLHPEELLTMNGFQKMFPVDSNPVSHLMNGENPNKPLAQKALGADLSREPFSKVLATTTERQEVFPETIESLENLSVEETLAQDDETRMQNQAVPILSSVLISQPRVGIEGLNTGMGRFLSEQAGAEIKTILTPSQLKPETGSAQSTENQAIVPSTSQPTPAVLDQRLLSLGDASLVTSESVTLTEEVVLSGKTDDKKNAVKTLGHLDDSKFEGLKQKAEAASSEKTAPIELTKMKANEVIPDLKDSLPVKVNEGATSEKAPASASEMLKDSGALAISAVSDNQEGSLGGEEGPFFERSTVPFSSGLSGEEGPSRIRSVKSDFQSLLESGFEAPDEAAILKQVAHELRLWKPGQNEPLRFLLQPKQLGMLQVEILFHEKGVTAHMLTADPFVKALLEDNQGFLQTGLKAQGFDVQQFSVGLGEQKGFMNQHKAQHFRGPISPASSELDTRESPFSGSGRGMWEAGRLSIYI